MVRVARVLVPLAVASGLAGCEWMQRIKKGPPEQQHTGEIRPTTAPELVGYLNQQAGYLHSVRYPDVSIEVAAGRETYNLRDSTLICAKPRNFLLSGGKAVIGEVVNLGSNDREFWMYSRFPEQNYVYCSHTDFQLGRGQLPVPFDPAWALQALGMHTYDDKLNYRVETDARNREHVLTVDAYTPQGAPVKKVVVFAADETTGRHPQVRRHLVLDSANTTIASAVVREAATVPAGGGSYVQVPTRVTLDWPQQQFRMDLKLGTPKTNERMTDAEAARLFAKPAIDGLSPVNLAEARFVPNARGATPRR
jgi:hypothetical protein